MCKISHLLAPLTVITALTGCQPAPSVEESLARCPQLVREGEADKAAFHAKSALHKEYAEVFGTKATALAMADQDARRPGPDLKSYDRLAYYASIACKSVHSEEKCQGPIVAEYAAYEERANKRMWEGIRYKCLSRTNT
jgi:hypothetical protein